MRNAHMNRDANGKKLRSTYAISYIAIKDNPRLRQIVHHPRKTIFINYKADWDADEVIHLCYGSPELEAFEANGYL